MVEFAIFLEKLKLKKCNCGRTFSPLPNPPNFFGFVGSIKLQWRYSSELEPVGQITRLNPSNF